jgi:hypothetical protein
MTPAQYRELQHERRVMEAVESMTNPSVEDAVELTEILDT